MVCYYYLLGFCSSYIYRLDINMLVLYSLDFPRVILWHSHGSIPLETTYPWMRNCASFASYAKATFFLNLRGKEKNYIHAPCKGGVVVESSIPQCTSFTCCMQKYQSLPLVEIAIILCNLIILFNLFQYINWL